MDARTRLAFFILKTRVGWIVRVDGFVYPPCANRTDALAKAIREAQAAERLGFASVVLAQSAAGERCHVRWCCAAIGGSAGGASEAIAGSPHPAVPAMADALTAKSALVTSAPANSALEERP
ncbi:hypothetical protein [Azospirillum lipoferum]|uniref:DUF2188 domain-containing protein n=1 Tax=Azospirillum lipoferum (strain 4B) TaxID=862719 RepID=G7ZC43_AZOL4|nr:hypothetical protein [Azospirillum lipoferum]CBS89100.1 protein of unknown function [Azospirillum lipoferum 4B]